MKKARLKSDYLFEEFPKSHNLFLVGQPALLHNMALKMHAHITSRETYSQRCHAFAPVVGNL